MSENVSTLSLVNQQLYNLLKQSYRQLARRIMPIRAENFSENQFEVDKKSLEFLEFLIIPLFNGQSIFSL